LILEAANLPGHRQIEVGRTATHDLAGPKREARAQLRPLRAPHREQCLGSGTEIVVNQDPIAGWAVRRANEVLEQTDVERFLRQVAGSPGRGAVKRKWRRVAAKVPSLRGRSARQSEQDVDGAWVTKL
jgi:hypothetical protein